MVKNFWGHFKTIHKHKFKVMELCFKCGLYKQGLLHDLSKYSPIEFISGVKYYQGFRSPIIREKEVLGYSRGWLHHKGRNKHHFEYWIDEIDGKVVGIEMEKKYLVEMFCDRMAATLIYKNGNYYNGAALDYYYHMNKTDLYQLIHPNTKKQLEELLIMEKEVGLDKTIAYIKKHILDKNT